MLHSGDGCVMAQLRNAILKHYRPPHATQAYTSAFSLALFTLNMKQTIALYWLGYSMKMPWQLSVWVFQDPGSTLLPSHTQPALPSCLWASYTEVCTAPFHVFSSLCIYCFLCLYSLLVFAIPHLWIVSVVYWHFSSGLAVPHLIYSQASEPPGKIWITNPLAPAWKFWLNLYGL